MTSFTITARNMFYLSKYGQIMYLDMYVPHTSCITIEVIVCNLLILDSYVYKAISSFPIQTNYQLYPFKLHL